LVGFWFDFKNAWLGLDFGKRNGLVSVWVKQMVWAGLGLVWIGLGFDVGLANGLGWFGFCCGFSKWFGLVWVLVWV